MALLEAEATDRLPHLAPIRRWRMAQSPFAFLRGSAVVMARDLAATPRTGLTVQACGDAHLEQFRGVRHPRAQRGVRPQRLRRDLPGPVGVGREAARGERRGGGARGRTRRPSSARSRCAASPPTGRGSRSTRRRARSRSGTRASTRPSWRGWSGPRPARSSCGRTPGARGDARASAWPGRSSRARPGALRIAAQPPLLLPVGDRDGELAQVEVLLDRYAATLAPDRRELIDRYRSATPRSRSSASAASARAAGRVAVNRRRRGAAAAGQGGQPLGARVRPRRAAGVATTRPAGGRGAARSCRPASDVFLGWARADDGRDFYVRQLRDMKLIDRDLDDDGRRSVHELRQAYCGSRSPAPTPTPATPPRSRVPRHQRQVRPGGRRVRAWTTPTRPSATTRPSSRRSQTARSRRSRADRLGAQRRPAGGAVRGCRHLHVRGGRPRGRRAEPRRGGPRAHLRPGDALQGAARAVRRGRGLPADRHRHPHGQRRGGAARPVGHHLDRRRRSERAAARPRVSPATRLDFPGDALDPGCTYEQLAGRLQARPPLHGLRARRPPKRESPAGSPCSTGSSTCSTTSTTSTRATGR